jgi:hypothetical protein
MNQRMRSVELYNMDILEREPELMAVDVKPKRMIGFNYAKTRDISDACVHFFLDDYQFERIWQYPTRYGYLMKADCVCLPNWSTWVDAPEELQRWNVYRNSAIGAWWQAYGMTVVPVLMWADEKSFEWCFKYTPRHSTVAVCAKGTQNSKEGRLAFARGMNAALEACEPTRVLLVGNADFDFGGVEVVRYEDEQIRRFVR